MFRSMLMFLIILIQVSIIAIPGVSAKTINGYEFNNNSANFSNKWFWGPIIIGKTLTFEEQSGPNDLYVSAIGTEDVYGVTCLKIEVIGEPYNGVPQTDYHWFAEDTLGNIHHFKKIEASKTRVINSDDDIPNIIMKANPDVNDSWSYTFDDHSTLNLTVQSKSVTIVTMGGATYTNCMKVKEVSGSSGETAYQYFARGVGYLKIEDHEGYVWVYKEMKHLAPPTVIDSSGGKFEVVEGEFNGTKVIFTAGTLSDKKVVKVTQPSDIPSLPVGMDGTAVPISIASQNDTFDKPVSITIPYKGATAPTHVYYYDEMSATWIAEGINVVSVDTENQLVTFTTTHFTIFAAGLAIENDSNSGGGGGGSGCFISTTNE